MPREAVSRFPRVATVPLIFGGALVDAAGGRDIALVDALYTHRASTSLPVVLRARTLNRKYFPRSLASVTRVSAVAPEIAVQPSGAPFVVEEVAEAAGLVHRYHW